MWGIKGVEESKMTPRFFKLGNEVIVFIEIGEKRKSRTEKNRLFGGYQKNIQVKNSTKEV